MKFLFRPFLGAAIIGTSLGSVASAQNVFSGTNVAEGQVEDLFDQIEDDAERDLDRFGNEGRPQGFTASLAARGDFKSGNTESTSVGIGADLNYVQGVNGYQLLLSYTQGSTDGETTEESLYYGLEYTRDFSPVLYGFAKLQGSLNEFSSFETDTFASFGAGYRIINEPNRQWSVQAGPGYRFAQLSDVTSADISEVAFGVGSNYSQRLANNLLLVNDTDLITSESDTVIYNDLSLSVSMTDTLALRTSLLTEYHTDPEPGFDNTDNTLGVSLVYTIN